VNRHRPDAASGQAKFGAATVTWLISTSRTIARTRVVEAGLLFALVFTPACGRRETRVEEGLRTRTLHLSAGAEPRDFDPQTTTLPTDGIVIRALMEGLAELDPVDCHPIPGVATRWEASADGVTWAFHLRPDARWSNGDPVTAHV
jgi:oligopeptide transport system substrate-binding protein